MSLPHNPAVQKPIVEPNDTVVPLRRFDDNDITRGSLLYITLEFEAVLDTDKIRRGLHTLVAHGDWRKLGARLRKAHDGKLEYHVPAEFTDERPGFIFTKEQHDISINDHSLASSLPRPTEGRPSVQNDPVEFITLARRADGPKKLADYLASDEPQLSVHVVSFNDATLLTVSWLHTLCDAMAMSEMLQALILILNGRQSEVPPVCPISEDPLASLGESPTEPYVNENRQLVGFALVVFFVRFVFNLLWYHNAQRIIYLPPNHVANLKAAATAELQDTSIRLSENDILSVLLTRLALRNQSPTSAKTVGIWNVLDVRGPLASTLLPPSSGVYLGNAVLGAIAFLPAHDIIAKPLGVAATYVRRAIEVQRTPAQMHAMAGTARKAEQAGRPCLFGDAQSKLFFYSNWTRAGFFQLDFSAASVSPRRESEKNTSLADGLERPDEHAVCPITVLFNSEAQHPMKTNTILGKDRAGGYWIEFNMENGNWDGVQEMLEQL